MSLEHLLQNSQALLYWALDLSAAMEKPQKSLTNQWDQKTTAKQSLLSWTQTPMFREGELIKQRSFRILCIHAIKHLSAVWTNLIWAAFMQRIEHLLIFWSLSKCKLFWDATIETKVEYSNVSTCFRSGISKTLGYWGDNFI